MAIYLLIFFTLMLLRFALQGQPRLRDQVYYLVLAFLFAFSAFRFQVGCDWWGYIAQWNAQEARGNLPSPDQREPLWWAGIALLQAIGLPYPWLNVTSNALFFVGIHAIARRQPDPLGFLVLLFPILIINMPMSGIRQGAAIGVLCFAFLAFMDRRAIRFAALVFIASLIHESSIVLLLMLPLVKGDYSRQRLFLAVLLALPGAFVLAQGDASQTASTRYIGTGLDAGGAIFRVSLLSMTGLGYFLFARRRWRAEFPQDFKLVTISALILSVLILIVPLSTVIGDRLGYYFIPLQTIIFARLPYLRLGPSRPILIVAPYLALTLIFLAWTSLSELFFICYTPYQTWILGLPAFTTF
ncbi:MAG: EpsG family protein [Maritimibacter sp.]